MQVRKAVNGAAQAALVAENVVVQSFGDGIGPGHVQRARLLLLQRRRQHRQIQDRMTNLYIKKKQ